MPPVFLFVVDTCMIEEEIGFLKSALAQAVELLPEKSLVGLITFGTYVQVCHTFTVSCFFFPFCCFFSLLFI